MLPPSLYSFEGKAIETTNQKVNDREDFQWLSNHLREHFTWIVTVSLLNFKITDNCIFTFKNLTILCLEHSTCEKT